MFPVAQAWHPEDSSDNVHAFEEPAYNGVKVLGDKSRREMKFLRTACFREPQVVIRIRKHHDCIIPVPSSAKRPPNDRRVGISWRPQVSLSPDGPLSASDERGDRLRARRGQLQRLLKREGTLEQRPADDNAGDVVEILQRRDIVQRPGQTAGDHWGRGQESSRYSDAALCSHHCLC